MANGGPRPAHDDVVAAVSATGGTEAASWVSEPDAYVLVPVAIERAERHDFFSLTPLEASHPIGVLLARRRDTGELSVTSGSPDAVWRVLTEEPHLADAPTIVQLLAPIFDSVAYLGAGSEPAVERTGSGWRVDLRVRELPEGDVERWRVDLREPSA